MNREHVRVTAVDLNREIKNGIARIDLVLLLNRENTRAVLNRNLIHWKMKTHSKIAKKLKNEYNGLVISN